MIKITEVETAVMEPDDEKTTFNKFIAAKNFGRKALEVIYFKKDGNHIVITAYWL